MNKLKDYPEPPFPPQKTGKPPGLEKNMSPRPEYKAGEYKAAGKLEGLVALITGGDSGIGRSVALLFAREGADVAFTHLEEETADARETRQAIEAVSKSALVLGADLRDPDLRG